MLKFKIYLFFCSTSHLSFSFAFFVHGESTVCASIDVRQHSLVRTLSKEHLAQASSQPQNGTNIQGNLFIHLLILKCFYLFIFYLYV